jgi:hypothetical protein
MLYEMVEDARSLPLGADKCILDRDKVLDLMDEIKAQLPVELGEAKKLIAAKAEYIAGAKREAEIVRQQAREQAKRLLSEDHTIAIARQKSQEMKQNRGARPRTAPRGQRILRRRPETDGRGDYPGLRGGPFLPNNSVGFDLGLQPGVKELAVQSAGAGLREEDKAARRQFASAPLSLIVTMQETENTGYRCKLISQMLEYNKLQKIV